MSAASSSFTLGVVQFAFGDDFAGNRAAWGMFGDRRPELDGILTTADGGDV